MATMDVLSASHSDDKIAWYENTDGQGTFGGQQVITSQANGANSVYAADLDGDGDMDVLSASGGDDNIAWYENTDGQGSFSDQQVIATQASYDLFVDAADLDGDGDIDVISASSGSPGLWNAGKAWYEDIAWYENLDGQGTFGPEQLITTQAWGAISIYSADIDGDGDMDVLSASYLDNKLAWYENRLVGDANDDGVFNSSDLVQIFQAGEYEDRGRYNSTYEEGDWNGDGDFDSSDIVLAFQTGLYEQQLLAARTSIFDDDVDGSADEKELGPMTPDLLDVFFAQEDVLQKRPAYVA